MAATAAATSASLFSSSNHITSLSSRIAGNNRLSGCPLSSKNKAQKRVTKTNIKAIATAPAAAAIEEIKLCVLPSWAEFDLGRAAVYWKTMNGLPPTAGEKLKLFYNPAATKLIPNEEFGVAFNGGFNQPIMCGGEPRAMLRKVRGKADPPIYTIQICIPKHATSLIFSFTNGTDWDGPYRLQFQVPKAWSRRPVEFFTVGLAEELSKEGACEQAIYPDTNTVATSCAMIGNLSVEGGDRCSLDLVLGCTDPSSPFFNPLANVDDGTCPLSDSED